MPPASAGSECSPRTSTTPPCDGTHGLDHRLRFWNFRTCRPELLDDASATQAFYRIGAGLALDSGCVDNMYAYCHSPAHMTAALACPGIAGLAAQYHRANPWAADHFGEITCAGRIFVGMSPLNRGRLINRAAGTPSGRLAALQWALADHRVSAVVITISSVEHLEDVIRTLGYLESAR